MFTLLRTFLYCVVFVTLLWVSQTPPEAVTFVQWVKLTQLESAQHLTFMLTFCIFCLDAAMSGIFSAPLFVCSRRFVSYSHLPFGEQGSIVGSKAPTPRETAQPPKAE